MWMVGSKNTMKVECDPERNFPLSIELRFGGMPKLKSSVGMWFSVSDAWYLVRELLKAIAKQYAAQLRLHWMARILWRPKVDSAGEHDQRPETDSALPRHQ